MLAELQQRHQAPIQLWRDYEAALKAVAAAYTALENALDESQTLLQETGRPKRPLTPDPGYTMAALAFEARETG